MNESRTDADAGIPDKLDRLDELLSLFFDDCLSEAEVDELNKLLLEDPAARSRSFDAAQLHADLHSFFNEKEERKPALPPLSLPTTGFGTPATS
ncbi:MAG: hypothetical protein AAF266_06220 [Planctomycetota bacterium]